MPDFVSYVTNIFETTWRQPEKTRDDFDNLARSMISGEIGTSVDYD